MPKLTLNKNDFYTDPDTEYSDVNLADKRLPFFTQMYTIDKPFIVIDGNKQIMAKMSEGIQSFEGFEITPNIVTQSFFTGLEMWFYTLLPEISLFSVLVFESKTVDEIMGFSNAFR